MNKHRTKDKYAIALDQIETSVKVDCKDTKGIIRYCKLNDMKYFHILDNYNADIMHDLAEGVIPFVLKNIFKFCIDNSLFTEEELRNNALTHDYGILNSKNIPTALHIEKHNLKQNASQMKCLLHNVPYILHKYKDDPRITKVWPNVISILEIVRIAYDANITNYDLDKLEAAVSTHMKSMIECFPNVNLLLKHHSMVHYANIIRAVGPVVHMSTMRFEMLHKTFTKFARRSNNFINLSKSLAVNFQKSKLPETPYQYEVQHSKLMNINNYIEMYENVLLETFATVERISETKWLRINNNYYRKGLLLKNNISSFCEIEKILCESGDFYFLCYEYELADFDSFLYSAEVHERMPRRHTIIKEKNLLVKKSFAKKIINCKSYIIADCLHIPVE